MSSRIMSFTLLVLSLFAIFAPLAQAISLSVAGPLVACEVAKLKFEGAVAPLTITIADALTGEVEEMQLTGGRSLGWFVDVAPNSNITITLKDSNGETAVLANQFVLEGEDDSCY